MTDRHERGGADGAGGTGSRIVDDAYRKLRFQVVKRIIPPGARISALSLTRKMHVSRTPIREALRRLQSEGFVAWSPGKGFVVTTISLEDIDHIYAIRVSLEGLAGRLAAPAVARDPARIAALEALLAETRALGEDGAVEQYADKNIEFHNLIFEATGNPWLISMLENLNLQVRRFIVNALHIPGRVKRSMVDHRAIVDRLKAGDAGGVEKLCAAHVRTAAEDLKREFTKRS
jgi:DNA-binding GntR family transcriptional regulator